MLTEFGERSDLVPAVSQGLPNVVHNSYGAQRTGLALSGKEIPIRLAEALLWSGPVGAGKATVCFRGWAQVCQYSGRLIKGDKSDVEMGSSYSEPYREEATNS